MPLTTPVAVKTGSNPSAGAEVTVTVPAGEYWVLYCVQLALVSSSTVATRNVELQIDDGTTTFFRNVDRAGQAASLTQNYTWACDLGYRDATAAVGGVNIGIPCFTLGPGYRVRTVTNNLQAGDDFAAPVLLVADYT